MKNFISRLIILLFIISGCSKDSIPEGEGKVIVLMYHNITEGTANDLYERSTADFEADLLYLQNNNIKVIGFDELEEMVAKKIRPVQNMAIITFDDGYRSWLTLARPLLIKYNMKATFFLWVSEIGSENFLNWDEVELMSHYCTIDGLRPFTFASHTLNHPFLFDKKLSFEDPDEYQEFLNLELGESKRIIEESSPVPVKVLALPYGNGAGEADIINAARRNGYTSIRTSIWGAIDPADTDLYNLPSLPMLDTSDPSIIGLYLSSE